MALSDVGATRTPPDNASANSITGDARVAPANACELFDLPEGIYLYSHAVGCLPHAARQGADAYFREWAGKGGDAWDAWLGEVTRFNSAIAALLHANASEISPQVNLSSALTKIIQALPRREGRDRIVLSLLDFPTIGFVAKQAERLGYEVVFAPVGTPPAASAVWTAPALSARESESTMADAAGRVPTADRAGPVPTEDDQDPRLAAIDERTALVLWTHAYPNTGTCVEPPPREQLQGAYLCVDIAQSAGVIPINVTKWDADFIIGSCVKWLCGGAGAGFIWVRPELVQQLEPLDVGWFSHARPFEFDITSFEYAPDASRFWGGTPSILPYAVAARSVELITKIGEKRIREHNLALSRLLIEAALAKGIGIVSPVGAMQSGTVVLDLDWDAEERLAAAGVHCDRRKFGVRLSPHIYNTAEEMQAVVGLL